MIARMLALLARLLLKPGPAACGSGGMCRHQAGCTDGDCPGHPRNT